MTSRTSGTAASGGRAASRGLALVTGASGFVGSHVAERLLAAGWNVRCLVRATSSRRWLDHPSFEFVTGDAVTGAGMDSACAGCQAVVHAAGITNAVRQSEFFRVNTNGTALLRDAAQRAGVSRFVFVSSLAAAGPGSSSVAGGVSGPVNAYGRSKLEAEGVLLESEGTMRVVVVRPPAVYGPRDRGILTLVRIAKHGWFPAVHGGRQRLSLIHVLDLVEGIRLILEDEAARGIYVVTDGEEHLLIDLGKEIGRALGTAVRVIGVPGAVLWALATGGSAAGFALGRPLPLNLGRLPQFLGQDWTESDARSRAELGYAPRYPLGRGMSETIAWYRKAAWI